MSTNTPSIWTDEETQLLYNLKKAGKKYNEIGEVLKNSIGLRRYTKNCLSNKWRGTDWKNFTHKKETTLKIVEEATDMEMEKEKVIATTLANNQRVLKREQARTEIIIDNCKSAIYRLPKPKASNLHHTPSGRKKYTSEHIGIMLSDLHIGEDFTHADTGGLSEYNLDVFKLRLERMKKHVLEIADRHRNMYEIPELHIFCLGDIIAGEKGAGQWNDSYITLDVYDQIFAGTEALRDVIATWSKAFPVVNFYGIYGNHGRVGKRGKEKASCNWDRICYNHVKVSLSEYDNINWDIPEAWFRQIKIQNHNFYLCHGDGIRGSSGVPYYGVEKAEAKITGLMNDRPDYILMGHFHTPAEIQTNSSRVLMNGAFSGGDMYSLKDLGRGSAPEQKIFGIHKKMGITWTYNIYLDKE